jgi:hypothetical protein
VTRATQVRIVIGLVVAVAVVGVVMIAPRAALPTEGRAPPPSPSASPTQLSTSVPPLAPSATPSASPTPDPEPVTAVWLLDTVADRSVKLLETTGYLLEARFTEGDTTIAVGVAEGRPEVRRLHRYALDGSPRDTREWTDESSRWWTGCVEIRSVYLGPQAPGGLPSLVEVDGRPIENASCGPISPDGRWMTYWIWSEETDAGRLPWAVDQYVIDLGTGQRRLLHAGLVHCGGCDSVPGPKWSPSGRYLYFSDVVGGGDRFFVSDVVSGRTRQLIDHVPKEPYDVPVWSPAADLLLRSDGSGTAVIENVANRTARRLPQVAWPARFDPGGSFVYSPAWPSESRTGTETLLVDTATGLTVTTLSGRPAPRVFVGAGGPPFDRAPIVGVPGGFSAALEKAAGCDGLALYSNVRLATCVRGAERPVISPDGTKVAVARATGDPVTEPRCNTCTLIEIVVVDVQSGQQIAGASHAIRIVVSGAHVVDPFHAVEFSWNAAGTHLLVAGPAAG